MICQSKYKLILGVAVLLLFIILVCQINKKPEYFTNPSKANKDRIPKIIYKSGPGKPAEIVQKLFDKTLRKNIGFQLKYYDDKKCRKFIMENFPHDVVDAFDSLKPGAYKADLFRYCILYKNGGVWSDLTDDYLVPLDEIIDFKNDELFLVDDRPVGKYNMAGIQISFMAAKPNNKLFHKCIRQIVKNTKNKIIGDTPFELTGPHLCRRKLNECLKDDPNFKHRIDYKFSKDGHYYENKKTGEKIGKYKSIGKPKLDKLLNKDTKYYLDMWFKKDIYN